MTGIVYAATSIYKCFNPANHKQNTSIKNQKSAQNKPFNENLSKPIPNTPTESYGQKTRYFKNSNIRHLHLHINFGVLGSRS